MQVQTSEVTIVRYDEYGNGGDGKPIAFGDGKMVEYVDVLAAGEESTRRITLDQSINGERPAAGVIVTLTCELRREGKVSYDRNGRDFVRQQDKWKVTGFALVKAPGATRS